MALKNQANSKNVKILGFWVIIGIIADISLGLLDKELALANKIGVDYFIQTLKIL
ncbi:hypothetical protein B10973_10780 [Campylobacter lari]|uniref:hypothetical protein n=1 Tax=Campylobacter lari TaxID=201 RepID=UPI000B1374CB|nr:hypothetical protein [Campylobacter lari]EFO9430126.1 hypothetical protein [Campylobacter lari]EHO5243989.1 hypothetical protein [Campylobacter lari]EKA0738180.1 hypothetical protein [Campylobacter lari]MBX2497364.1 hypothetical protein [Campylobacter lari]MCV3452008.1 hypothetical protein [Campylobacter lari]